MTEATGTSPADPFGGCRDRFETLVGFLEGGQAAGMCHAELEQRIQLDGREVLRLAAQGHLELRAEREERLEEVTDADGVARGSVEADHQRVLTTVFGEVTVRRLALPSPPAAEPAPRRRGAEPARRASLPRPSGAGRYRGGPGLIRRLGRRHRTCHRTTRRQTPGGTAGQPSRGGRRGVL